MNSQKDGITPVLCTTSQEDTSAMTSKDMELGLKGSGEKIWQLEGEVRKYEGKSTIW